MLNTHENKRLIETTLSYEFLRAIKDTPTESFGLLGGSRNNVRKCGCSSCGNLWELAKDFDLTKVKREYYYKKYTIEKEKYMMLKNEFSKMKNK